MHPPHQYTHASASRQSSTDRHSGARTRCRWPSSDCVLGWAILWHCAHSPIRLERRCLHRPNIHDNEERKEWMHAVLTHGDPVLDSASNTLYHKCDEMLNVHTKSTNLVVPPRVQKGICMIQACEYVHTAWLHTRHTAVGDGKALCIGRNINHSLLVVLAHLGVVLVQNTREFSACTTPWMGELT